MSSIIVPTDGPASIILFTSPCGVGARDFLTGLAAAAPGTNAHSLDDDILEALKHETWYSARSEPADKLRAAWSAGLRHLAASGAPKVLLHTHLVHYDDALQLFFPIGDPRAVLESGAVLAVVTLCDDVYETLTKERYSDLWSHIEDPGAPKERADRYLDSIETILLWRRLDLISAEGLARTLQVSHYLISVRHDPTHVARLLVNILARQEPKTFYLSHHIREVCAVGPSWKDEARLINVAAARIADLGFTVFEPTTIDEYILGADGAVRDRWPRTYDGRHFTYVESLRDCLRPLDLQPESFAPSDLHRTMRQVDRDVTWRDLRLVYQSKGLLMWRPFWRGKVSSGAMRELSVFAGRSDSGPAVLVHQRGDVAAWATAILRRAVAAHGGSEKGAGFAAQGALIEEQSVTDGVSWDAIVTDLQASISGVTKARGVLTEGGATAGRSVAEKRLEIAREAVKELQNNDVLQTVESLRRSGRLRHIVGSNLDSSGAVESFICAELRPFLEVHQ